MKLFNFDHFCQEESMHAKCRISDQQVIDMRQAINDVLQESFAQRQDDGAVEVDGIQGKSFQVMISPLEMAQAAAEKLNTELTPEHGFYISSLVYRAIANSLPEGPEEGEANDQ
mgnify:CR=1 FL=1|tara:strand:+ start:3613 stop:3954 length:342 start_codon:yes stop_codon:yes gene_type:complete